MNLYRWPIIGRWLRNRTKAQGAHIAGGLVRRGYSPEAVLVYANRCTAQAAKPADLYFYIGMAQEAADRLDWARGGVAKL